MTLNESTDAYQDTVVTPWTSVRDEIATLNVLGPNWDGEGSLPMRPGLFDAASTLCQMLEQEDAPPDDIYLGPDGSLLLEWHFEDGFITIVNVRVPDHAEVICRSPGQPPLFSTFPISFRLGEVASVARLRLPPSRLMMCSLPETREP